MPRTAPFVYQLWRSLVGPSLRRSPDNVASWTFGHVTIKTCFNASQPFPRSVPGAYSLVANRPAPYHRSDFGLVAQVFPVNRQNDTQSPNRLKNSCRIGNRRISKDFRFAIRISTSRSARWATKPASSSGEGRLGNRHRSLNRSRTRRHSSS